MSKKLTTSSPRGLVQVQTLGDGPISIPANGINLIWVEL